MYEQHTKAAANNRPISFNASSPGSREQSSAYHLYMSKDRVFNRCKESQTPG
jgi:hypothetical protein